ncbi:hypothetical protein EC042_0844 [Escherichia coli 042]|uniref:Uncharacterized protein n=1 Tax=Escherichia coli O44:H18 (strain 042 / EAEC) TaxID=216592 RepID=D3GZ01_ECO44|nr:hypothetical protein EC042_0844 [Escherichia coli 042]
MNSFSVLNLIIIESVKSLSMDCTIPLTAINLPFNCSSVATSFSSYSLNSCRAVVL